MSDSKIPNELKKRNQWVCWNTETRDDKPTKVLKNPSTGGNAMANNHQTWGSFDSAKQAADHFSFNGIGFVFSDKDDYCGIDLDKCRDPESGEIEPWAEDIINKLSSYTEVSPSKTGVHIIVKASLPPEGRRSGKIEMYDNGRYFTMTGDHLSESPSTIEDRQKELEALHKELFAKPDPVKPLKQSSLNSQCTDDKEILEIALRSKNGFILDRLIRGDYSDYPSQSEADLALCSKLAFWFGKDAFKIDGIFRQSGLYRKKWDVKHFSDGSTYGQQVIRMAIANTHEVYAPNTKKDSSFVIPLYSSDDDELKGKNKVIRLCEIDEPEPMKFVVEDFAPEGYPTLVHGDGGQGKSYIMLCLATAVASGSPFLDRKTIKGKVLYVDFELDKNEQARRAHKIARGFGLKKPPENLLYYSPIEQEQSIGSLNAIIDGLTAIIAVHNVILTVIDSFGAAVSGDPESARDVTSLFQGLRKLGSIIILDHQSKVGRGENYKDKTAFGSVYKSNLSRNVWQLQRIPHESMSPENEVKLALHHKKSNFGPIHDSIGLKAIFGNKFTLEVIELDPSFGEAGAIDSKAKVYVAFQTLGESTAKEIAEETGLGEGTVKNKITALKEEGRLIDTGKKEGKAHIYRPSVSSSPSHPIRDDDDDESFKTTAFQSPINEKPDIEEAERVELTI